MIEEKENTQMAEDKIGVLLAIDSPIRRLGAHQAISKEKDMDVVGEVGKDNFSLSADVHPKTVLLVAINAWGDQGLLRQLRKTLPEIPIVVLAEYEDDNGLFQAVVNGACAFLTKLVTGDQLIDILRNVSIGERPVCHNVINRPRVASRILEWFRDVSLAVEGIRPLLAPLSSREERAFVLIAAGNSIEEMTSSMGMDRQGVMDCVASVLRKLEIERAHQFHYEEAEILKDRKDDIKYMAGARAVSEGFTNVAVDTSVILPQIPENFAISEGQMEIAVLPPVPLDRLISLRRYLLNALRLETIRTAGHVSSGILITAILEMPAPLVSMLIQTPGVEKVEVGLSEKGSADYYRNLGSRAFQLEPASCQKEMIFVTLKEDLE